MAYPEFLKVLNPVRWKKSVLTGILVVAAVSWILFFDTFSMLTRFQLARKEDQLKNEIQRLEAQIQELETQIERLENDPALLERIAREEYGMRKPGETVYTIEQKP